MLKKIVITLAVAAVGGLVWWLWQTHTLPRSAKLSIPISDEQFTATTSLVATGSANESDMKVYRNEEWGFQFDHPVNWTIRIPAFGSAASLFNMAVGSGDRVTINLTPKNWIENAMVKMEARGVVFEHIFLDGRPAFKTEDYDRFSRPAIVTFVLVDDEYWIDLTGVIQYKDEYYGILNSFQFLDQ